jgi:hypothetical protein
MFREAEAGKGKNISRLVQCGCDSTDRLQQNLPLQNIMEIRSGVYRFVYTPKDRHDKGSGHNFEIFWAAKTPKNCVANQAGVKVANENHQVPNPTKLQTQNSDTKTNRLLKV